MGGLTQATCVPCRGGVPVLTDAEIADLRPQVPEWEVAEADGVKRIRREFRFRDFRQALDFTAEVGELAAGIRGRGVVRVRETHDAVRLKLRTSDFSPRSMGRLRRNLRAPC